jgi:adenylate cyclase
VTSCVRVHWSPRIGRSRIDRETHRPSKFHVTKCFYPRVAETGVPPELPENERRLAAIMFTDIVGYTALTQSDESQTLEVLARHNRLLRPFFPKFHGREVKTIGDSFLVEFESALDAINCAVEIQKFLHDYNISSRDEWKIILRIGIHLGDVVHSDDEDVFGDAVNIAARIQPLAEPEGICISDQVYSQVRNKVSQTLVKMAPKELKNVRFPIDVYRVMMPWDHAAGTARSSQGDKNRIAVLPFANLSPDPNDEYFADGMTEELIDKLSKIPGLRVPPPTSSFYFKSKLWPRSKETTQTTIADISKALGVAYILDGSVRKSGDRLRVDARLIRGDSGYVVWSETYDRPFNDILMVQDDIAGEVTKALKASIEGGPN